MKCWSKIIVRKANIIYPAENFYCAGLVMSEAFGKFRNTSPRVTDDVRAGRREQQTAAEKLSHNIAKRWRMGETRCSHGKWYFEFLSTRCETGVAQSRVRKARMMYYISGKRVPVLTGSCEYRYIWYGSEDLTFRRNVSHPILCTFSSNTKYTKRESIIFLLLFIYTIEYQTEKNRRRKNFDIFCFIVPARSFLLCWHGNFYCSHNIFWCAAKILQNYSAA